MAFHCFFGVPGSGKTTHAAMIAYQSLKRGIAVFSNVDIKGCYKITKDDIGHYQISDCILIIDEAGIDFNSRKYKSLGQEVIEWFKLYRHYNVLDIYVYSQSWEDYDITLRRLTDRLYIVRRTLIPSLFSYKPIRVRIDIDKESKQIIDAYSFKPFSLRLFSGRKYWFMFDSWSAPELPHKRFDLLGFSDLPIDDFTPKDVYKLLKRSNSKLYRLRSALSRVIIRLSDLVHSVRIFKR